jgi:peptide/nickel transport system substrate-binding protein
MPHRVATQLGIIACTLFVLLAACAAPPPVQRSTGTEPEQPSRGPKRIVTAIMVEPGALYRPLIPGGFVIQTGDLGDTILGIGLSGFDHQGILQPKLAEAVPSVENGLWRVLPSGQMELVWKIRPGAAWHDGTPFTTDDLLFTVQLSLDPSLPEFRGGAAEVWDLVDGVQAVDAQTIAVTWKRPYIKVDRIFSTGSEAFAQPLPRHLLERAYAENQREAFVQLPYWTREYVGLGPYKLRDWIVGSHLLLEANPRYVLGRPKIDELEVRFILDANTLGANVLAGAVRLTLGIGLNLEQNLEIRDQWRDGSLQVAQVSYWVALYPQLLNPNPPIISDVRFRRALIQAIDRQAMADTIMAGLVPIAHSYIKPDAPEARETDSFVVRYDYDPRRATLAVEELGYTRGADGVFRDPAGQRLGFEVRATSSPAIHQKAMFPVVDYFQRLGLAAEPLVIPVQRAADREYRTTMPAFDTVRYPIGPSWVDRLHSSEAPLPENRFQGRSRARYMNPEFDALIDRYMATIPWGPRMQVLGQVLHHMTDQLINMGLFYDVETTLVSNQLVNVPAQNPTANIHEWDVKG